MQIKKFHADSFATAMEQVKRELGEHALILNSQCLKAGMKSGKPNGKVEITAAADLSYGEDAEIDVQKDSIKAEEVFDGMDVRSLLLTLLSQTDRAKALGLADYQLPIYRKLIEGGINDQMVARMFERLNSKKRQDVNRNAIKDETLIRSFMERAIVCSGSLKTQKGYPKVIVLVGPTGVGKTTTIAKLAAHYKVREMKKVAMISLDTYRIGAINQLQVYGEIMKVPVEAADDAKQYRRVLKKHSDKDFIFVDTTGKPHKDFAYSRKLKEILRASGPVEIHLVLSAVLREKVWEESQLQYSSLKIDRALITKLDEGTDFGSLFNFSLKTRIPYSFFTAGQRVPEDMEIASSRRVIQLIFKSFQDRLWS